MFNCRKGWRPLPASTKQKQCPCAQKAQVWSHQAKAMTSPCFKCFWANFSLALMCHCMSHGVFSWTITLKPTMMKSPHNNLWPFSSPNFLKYCTFDHTQVFILHNVSHGLCNNATYSSSGHWKNACSYQNSFPLNMSIHYQVRSIGYLPVTLKELILFD